MSRVDIVVGNARRWELRKSRKLKRRSCKLCKPNKMGWDVRWNRREFVALRRFEREVREQPRD